MPGLRPRALGFAEKNGARLTIRLQLRERDGEGLPSIFPGYRRSFSLAYLSHEIDQLIDVGVGKPIQIVIDDVVCRPLPRQNHLLRLAKIADCDRPSRADDF